MRNSHFIFNEAIRSVRKKITYYLMSLLIVLNIIIIGTANFITPVWAKFVQSIGGDLRTAGNAIGIFAIILGIFTYLAGMIENKLQKNELFLVLTQGMFAIGYLGYLLIHHAWQLYLIQIWLGLAGAFQAPALYSLYQSYIPREKVTWAWGLWNASFNVAMGLGALAGSYLVSLTDFNIMFIFLSATAFSGLILAFIIRLQILKFTPDLMLHKNS